jgi:cysteine-rich repeat protein
MPIAMNKALLASASAMLLMLLLPAIASAASGLGESCQNNSGCLSGTSCIYKRCLPPPGKSCSSVYDCTGSSDNSLMECVIGECCGRHAYPCKNDTSCCTGFVCNMAGTNGVWPYYNFCVYSSESKCTDEGHVSCEGSGSGCNIGHNSCLAEPPAKSYTVPSNQRCTFKGTITNSGCAWQNPAALTIRGNGCDQVIRYQDCEVKSFTFTCGPGEVTLAANDSSYFTLSYSCTSIERCGNGVIDSGELCEPPITNNNPYCKQTMTECLDHKVAIRDEFGNCNSVCSCFEDDFNYYCVKNECGAECATNADCNDNNPATTDTCLDNCMCSNGTVLPSCGNGILDSGESCEPPATNNNAYCAQSTQECSGRKLGVRDGLGYCGVSCNCIGDAFTYSYVKGSCGAECGTDADCNDNNQNTIDTCSSTGTCLHETMPSCGNGILDSGEDCETSSQCSAGKSCVSCKCVISTGSYCGDGKLDAGEECDKGSYNGVICVPPNNGSCTYCSRNCTLITSKGKSCGNGIVDYGEQCDDGSSNGVQCSPRCGDFCAYCNTNCSVSYVDGADCEGDDFTWPYDDSNSNYPYSYYGGYGIPNSYYGGYYGNRPRVAVCGDGILGVGEDCDRGSNNGVQCSPECGGECTYCTSSCKMATLQGSACVRRPRPWDTYQFCRDIYIPISEARLDDSCGGKNADVTMEVSSSDNSYAQHSACNLAPSYMYFSWTELRQLNNFNNLSVVVEHREEYSTLGLEYYDGASWKTLCSIYSAAKDNFDTCLLPDFSGSDKISLRARIGRTGGTNKALIFIDMVALKLVYCNDASPYCGDGKLDTREECDDGNLLNGDGCSSICTAEKWACGDWGACTGSQQSQTCALGENIKLNTRDCSSEMTGTWWLFVVIIIILLLLFIMLPLFFVPSKEHAKRK